MGMIELGEYYTNKGLSVEPTGDHGGANVMHKGELVAYAHNQNDANMIVGAFRIGWLLHEREQLGLSNAKST